MKILIYGIFSMMPLAVFAVKGGPMTSYEPQPLPEQSDGTFLPQGDTNRLENGVLPASVIGRLPGVFGSMYFGIKNPEAVGIWLFLSKDSGELVAIADLSKGLDERKFWFLQGLGEDKQAVEKSRIEKILNNVEEGKGEPKPFIRFRFKDGGKVAVGSVQKESTATPVGYWVFLESVVPRVVCRFSQEGDIEAVWKIEGSNGGAGFLVPYELSQGASNSKILSDLDIKMPNGVNVPGNGKR